MSRLKLGPCFKPLYVLSSFNIPNQLLLSLALSEPWQAKTARRHFFRLRRDSIPCHSRDYLDPTPRRWSEGELVDLQPAAWDLLSLISKQSRNRLSVFSLARISIISPTLGPCFRPLRQVLSSFMNPLYSSACWEQNCFSRGASRFRVNGAWCDSNSIKSWARIAEKKRRGMLLEL